jgi:hypothetical protein
MSLDASDRLSFRVKRLFVSGKRKACFAIRENVVTWARNRATNGSDPHPGAVAPQSVAALPLCETPSEGSL